MKTTLAKRIKSFFNFGGEGSYRGPFFGQGENGGWFELGKWADGFQQNLTVSGNDARRIPAAYAAVMANARAVSQCYATHRRVNSDGKHEIIKTSPAARVLKNPNDYESWPQFISNMVAELQFAGESFAIVVRDKREVITALHKCPQRTCAPYVAEDGSIYYSVGANPMRPDLQDYMVPARDVLHLRNDCPRHPLIGESPIKAAALSAGVNVALSQSQAAFFNRMSRPSGIISTDQLVTKEQMDILRAAWESQSAGISQGGIPVLGGGMKFQSMGVTSQDAQLIQAQRMSIEDIARVFGVPLPVIGDLTNSTLSNVEQLVSLWLSISLGALLENIERSFDRLFKLGPDEYIQFDTAALLRTDFIGRIDGLTKGVQGGLFTPNEARAKEGLHPVEHGDVPYLQAQMQELGTKPEPVEPTIVEPLDIDEVATETGKKILPELKNMITSMAEKNEPLSEDDAAAVAEAKILKAMA